MRCKKRLLQISIKSRLRDTSSASYLGTFPHWGRQTYGDVLLHPCREAKVLISLPPGGKLAVGEFRGTTVGFPETNEMSFGGSHWWWKEPAEL